MNHQDLNTIIIGKPKKKSGERNIIPKNNGPDLHSIKIENETENFQIKKVPNALAKEIMSIRNLKKITQKDFKVVEGKRRNGDPAILIASNQNAKAKLKIELRYPSLKDIIKTVL